MHISPADLQLFLDEVRARYGLVFERTRHDELRELITERAAANRVGSAGEYIAALRDSEDEWQEVANRLTVPETYFFRIPEQFEAFAAVALPNVIQARRSARRLKIASLGCASGEEPYTMAMILRSEYPQLRDWHIDITGFDVSQRALERARRGVYSKWSLRATPEAMRERFFRATRNGYEVDAEIRAMVRFEARNILDLCQEPAGSYDVVSFRNVLIYFSPDSIRASVACAAHMLAPGGYFFIGTAETLRGVTNAFSLCHSHGAFYYRREGGRPEAVGRVRKVSARYRPESRPAEQEQPSGIVHEERPVSTSWIEEIHNSTSRITELTSESNEAADEGPATNIARRAALSSAMAMFASEKYSAALQELDRLSDDNRANADVQVLRAVLLANSGQIADARTAAEATLRYDHLNAGAHYVLAMCEEQSGDLPAAIEHDTMASYLDPTFAMPHVHAATIHRRRNEMRSACEEMERALTLLAAEDASRILLFGGGFSREALQSYCERELKSCRSGK